MTPRSQFGNYCISRSSFKIFDGVYFEKRTSQNVKENNFKYIFKISLSKAPTAEISICFKRFDIELIPSQVISALRALEIYYKMKQFCKTCQKLGDIKNGNHCCNKCLCISCYRQPKSFIVDEDEHYNSLKCTDCNIMENNIDEYDDIL